MSSVVRIPERNQRNGIPPVIGFKSAVNPNMKELPTKISSEEVSSTQNQSNLKVVNEIDEAQEFYDAEAEAEVNNMQIDQED